MSSHVIKCWFNNILCYRVSSNVGLITLNVYNAMRLLLLAAVITMATSFAGHIGYGWEEITVQDKTSQEMRREDKIREEQTWQDKT